MAEYHDGEWGVPCHDDGSLFERLMLEGFQAGLSWELILKRREGGDLGALPVGPNVTSFEEAVSSYSPRLKLTVGSPDLAKLEQVEELVGQSAVIEGIVTDGVTPNIGVVQIGARSVFLFLPTQKAWGGDYAVGTRVEVVAVVVGTQTLGDRTLPLLRAVWMRPAFGG